MPKPTAANVASSLTTVGVAPMKDKFVKEMREKKWSLDVKIMQRRIERAEIQKGYLDALKHRDRVCDVLRKSGKAIGQKFRKELEDRKLALDNEIAAIAWMLLKIHTDFLVLESQRLEVTTVLE
jgi:hypothetical protein